MNVTDILQKLVCIIKTVDSVVAIYYAKTIFKYCELYKLKIKAIRTC